MQALWRARSPWHRRYYIAAAPVCVTLCHHVTITAARAQLANLQHVCVCVCSQHPSGDRVPLPLPSPSDGAHCGILVQQGGRRPRVGARARHRAAGDRRDAVGSRSGETLNQQGRDFLSRRWPQGLGLPAPWIRAAAQCDLCGFVLLQIQPWSQHDADPEAEFWNEFEGPQDQLAVFRVIDRVLFPQSTRIATIPAGSVASMRRLWVALESRSLASLRDEVDAASQRWHVGENGFMGVSHTGILLAPSIVEMLLRGSLQIVPMSLNRRWKATGPFLAGLRGPNARAPRPAVVAAQPLGETVGISQGHVG